MRGSHADPRQHRSGARRHREDWDETELQWFLVRRAELFYVHRSSDRLRRIAYNNALRTRGL